MTMTTAPVKVRKPVFKSALETVFDIPFSTNYRIEALLPDKTIKVFESVKMYVEGISTDGVGNVSVRLMGKPDKDGLVTINGTRYSVPRIIQASQYFSHAKDSLFAVKRNDVKTVSDEDSVGLAMNYGLFQIPWERCCIIYRDVDGEDMWAEMTRHEWDHGEVKELNRELQMFLSVPRIRFVPLAPSSRMASCHPNVAGWISRALSFLG